MQLKLNGLEVDCVIGDLPDERVREQRLTLDVVLELKDGADESDRLEDTVDYVALGEAIRRALVNAKCRMIERAAKLAWRVCRDDPRVVSAEVTVTKAGVVKGLRSASATYRG